MATINLAIETALRGLIANQTAIDTTAHNIANMNNPNYSRQIADITATASFNDTENDVQLGTGSSVSNIERIRDTYLDNQIWSELQNQGQWQVIDTTMQNLQAIFPDASDPSAPGLNAQLTAFWNSWTTLAANPGNVADQTAVYNTAQNLSQLFNETSASLNGLQLNLTQQLEGTITNINSDLQQIAQLNKQIIIVKGLGQQPNDLLDQMDGILNNLSSLVNVNIRTMQDGTTGVFLQGNALVNDTNYMQFKPIGGQKDGALEDVGLIQPGQIDPTNVTSLITSGQLGGILQARDQEVSSFKMQLDNLASSLINVVNQFEDAEPGPDNSNTNFFVGSDAASIAVNPALQNGANILTTSGNQGNVATLVANLQNKLLDNFVMSDPGTGFASTTTLQTLGITANGYLQINDGTGNLVTVDFTKATTIAQLVQAMNVNPAQFSAIYNNQTQQLFMVGDGPITISEFTGAGTPLGTLLGALNLVETQVSAAPANYNIGALDPMEELNSGISWANQMNNLDTQISPEGILNVVINGVTTPVPWNQNWTLQFTTLKIANAGGFVESAFLQDIQEFQFELGLPANGNILSPFNIVDKTGNLTTAMRLTGNLTFGDAYNAIMGQVNTDSTDASNMLSEYNSAVSQLQTEQNNIKAVDETQEETLAAQYQNAYDASEKILTIIDEMMTTLINIGTPAESSTASGAG